MPAMRHRFFSQSPIVSERAWLEDAEAHHFTHVLRGRVGEELVLFDGSGTEFTARVVRIGRAVVDLVVLSQQWVDRELSFPLTLGVALPKGERQQWLVEKAVELGVTRLVPLMTSRGVAQPVEQALARLRRTVIEASKQSGRNRLMLIAPPQSLAEYVSEVPAAARRWLAHPASRSSAGGVVPTSQVPWEADATYLAVGPEGGLADEEVSLVRAAGWQVIDLGPRTLRVETAAIALASLLVLRVTG